MSARKNDGEEFRRKMRMARRRVQMEFSGDKDGMQIRQNPRVSGTYKKEVHTGAKKRPIQTFGNYYKGFVQSAIEEHSQADEEDNRYCYASATVEPCPGGDTYFSLLSADDHGVIMQSNTFVAIKELDQEKNVLTNCYCVLVSIDDCMWCSSCHVQKLSLVLTSPDGDTEGFISKADCIHLTILPKILSTTLVDWKHFLQDEDDHAYFISSTNQRQQVYPVSESSALVYSDNMFGTVTVYNRKIQCCCMNHHRQAFITTFKSAIEDPTSDDLLLMKDYLCSQSSYRNVYMQIAHSKSSIAITSTTNCQLSPNQQIDPLLPCETCAQCKGETMEKVWFSLPLYILDGAFAVEAPLLRCTACKWQFHFDGNDIGVLNMGDYLVSHALLRDYFKLYAAEGLTMYGYYRKWFWTVTENDGAVDECSYTRFRAAWLSFIDLLHIPDNSFWCSICGVEPSVVICDGITLAFQRKHLKANSINISSLPKLDGCLYESSIYVKDKKLRDRLNTIGDLVESSLIEATKNILGLHKVLKYLEDADPIPGYWKRLLRDVATSSPVCAYIKDKDHFDSLILKQRRHRLTKSVILDSLSWSPVLYEFLSQSSIEDRDACIEMLEDLQCILNHLKSFKPHPRFPKTVCNDISDGVFPALKCSYERGAYTMDRIKSVNDCNKLSKQHGSLLPGLFLMYCAHSVCYGFQVMEGGESPNIPFTVIMRRFSKAPNTIIYDNSCHLERYCVGRCPEFFSSTKFYVDRLHWFNHTGCSRGYNISLYPELKEINTQVAEQRNSTLRRLKAMLSYMNQDNFIVHVKLFLMFRNLLTNNDGKLRSDLDKCFSSIKKLYKKH